MVAPPFPYKYTPVHPFLHIAPKLHPILTPMRILCRITGIVVGPIKLFFVAISMGLGAIINELIAKGMDPDHPLSGVRKVLFRLSLLIFWKLTVALQGLVVIRKHKEKFDPDARVIVSNH